MAYVLAVFRSRTQVLELIEYMRRDGFDARAMNTPAEAHIGCGICAYFPAAFLPHARFIIKDSRLGSFMGFYVYERKGARSTVRRLDD